MITKEVQIFDKEAMTAEMCIETALAALTVSPTSASSVQGGVALNTPTTSSLASDDDHAGRYFSMFEDFVPVHTASLQQEFGRLAVSKGWRKKSAEWKEQRLQCLRMEYDHFVGQLDMSKLDIWQSLCVEIAGVQDPPTSITQCKKVHHLVIPLKSASN